MDGEGELVVQDGAGQVGAERLAHQRGPVVAGLRCQPHRTHAHLLVNDPLQERKGR